MPSQDEVEEFAALLRHLKARTDLSYAALARPLDVNASTLHRYCAGEAVPLGFTAVERFAALCGADPAERVELHRRWILAVAARRRSRTAAPDAPDATGTPDLPPTPAPAPRTRWYRHRAGLAAVVVTALAAALVGLSALTSPTTAKTPDPRHGSPTPPAPASVEKAAPETTAPPLTWTVNSHLWATGCDHDYVIDKAPRQVPPPPLPQDAAPWARSQGAVHGGRTLVDITVQGRTDTAVVLEALRVRVVKRSAPLQGTVYFTGQGCGADLDPRTFAVDLDEDRPVARPARGVEGGTGTPARRMPYRVSAKDPEVLMIDARTVDCDCGWYLELDWSSQGRTGTTRIDDHGTPFRTSGTKGLPQYWYTNDGWTPTA
ncbi:helix-turn-helix transcriptional regulator [Streptomyces scabiei]|uniref:helix-turn-helix domain-containing protein n=1 Tax=Streptomyces scabiei TaxID=1930 RepID=UPI003410ADAA